MYFFQHLPQDTVGNNHPKMGSRPAVPPGVYIGKVVNIEDTNDGNRIYVKIPGFDLDSTPKNDSSLRAMPFMPRFIHVLPHLDEHVFVFIVNSQRPYGERLWFGPIISQPQLLKVDKFDYFTLTQQGSIWAPEAGPSTKSDSIGAYAKTDDEVAFQGRDNADLIIRPREIVLRAGKFIPNTSTDPKKSLSIPNYNKKNPAYVKLSFDTPIQVTDVNTIRGSVTTMVGDKLLLLTHSGALKPTGPYDLTVPNHEISEQTILNLVQNAQPAVYGQKLLDFLVILKRYLLTHAHAYHNEEAMNEEALATLLSNFNLNEILATNIRLV